MSAMCLSTAMSAAGMTTGFSLAPAQVAESFGLGSFGLLTLDFSPLNSLIVPCDKIHFGELHRRAIFYTMKVELGEYAGDQGFLLPKPVSIHPEYLRLRFRVARCMQKLQKMKLLGIKRYCI